MGKKFFIILNLLLAAVFAWRLVALYKEIGYKGAKPPGTAEIAAPGIKRTAVELSPEYRNIFGTTAAETTKEISRHGAAGSGALNELITGDEVVRVQGIFITEDGKYAVLSIVNKKGKKQKTEDIKVAVGDRIRGFTVEGIKPGYVSLTGSESNRIDLKIFVTVHGSKVQGFKVPFSSPNCIWDAYLREKRQFCQV